MNNIKMRGELEFTLPYYEKFDNQTDYLDFQGFSFEIGDKKIDFSFEKMNLEYMVERKKKKTDPVRVNVRFNSAGDFLLNGESTGAKLEKIDALLLSHASKISKIEMDSFIKIFENYTLKMNIFQLANFGGEGFLKFKKLAFADGTKEFPVKKDVLKKFNKALVIDEIKNYEDIQNKYPYELCGEMPREMEKNFILDSTNFELSKGFDLVLYLTGGEYAYQVPEEIRNRDGEIVELLGWDEENDDNFLLRLYDGSVVSVEEFRTCLVKKEDAKVIACDIEYDTDYDDDADELPEEIVIPDDIDPEDDDEISDYISDVTGFCHKGFNIKYVANV